VERGGHNLVHQMFQDYLRRNEKPEKITYAAEATYEDYKGVEYCAQWNYEFYPMKKVLTERGSTHTSLLTVSSVQTRKRASTRDESGKAS